MSSPFDLLPEAARDDLQEQDHPGWTEPMLAVLTDDPFSDPDWIFERKLDGERSLAFRNGDQVRLLSRNRNGQAGSYPEIAEAFADQSATDFVVDGEVVAFEGDVTSFSRLQDRMQLEDPDEARATGIAVYYYAFDLLHLDGHDTTKLALRHRKSLLKEALEFQDPIRFVTHRNQDGLDYLEEACRKGWEGLIAKKADGPYRHTRSRDWLKFKCVNQQEFVIGGWTDPEGERIGFGALLIGYYEDDDLVYAGKVGTGYDDETLRRLADRLECRERKTPPFVGDGLPSGGVHWATPELVAEVGFTEWTDDGKLRHPRFLGLRRDKDPTAVVRERPS